MTIVAWTWLATPVVGSLPAGERATGLGPMMSTMMPDAHFVPLSQAIPLPGSGLRLSAPYSPCPDRPRLFLRLAPSVPEVTQRVAVLGKDGVTSLASSRSHRTEPAVAMQISQSAPFKLTVENACCRKGR